MKIRDDFEGFVCKVFQGLLKKLLSIEMVIFFCTPICSFFSKSKLKYKIKTTETVKMYKHVMCHILAGNKNNEFIQKLTANAFG